MRLLPKPTDAELEILRVLWRHGAATVRFVNERVNEAKGDDGESEVGYTTTLKLMQIMTDKNLLARDESSRTHVYAAKAREQDVQRNMTGKLVETAFGGSAMKMVMQALGNSAASKEELDEIRKILQQKEQELSRQPGENSSKGKRL